MTVTTALGLMSGTSMDGIDLALLRTDGRDAVARGPSHFVPYEAAFRRRIEAGLETAKAIVRREQRPGDLAALEREITLRHAAAVPELRTTSTLEGLRAAADAGLLADADADALGAGWTMATRARNAVTMVRGKPTDQLPGSGRELAATAMAMGYPAGGDPGEFIDEYRRVTRRARAVVERVFYEGG